MSSSFQVMLMLLRTLQEVYHAIVFGVLLLKEYYKYVSSTSSDILSILFKLQVPLIRNQKKKLEALCFISFAICSHSVKFDHWKLHKGKMCGEGGGRGMDNRGEVRT